MIRGTNPSEVQGLSAETIPVGEGEDFDLEKVGAYMRERIGGLPEGQLEVRQFPSGASNLTYLVKIGNWEGVLRRPPLGPVPPKAHDMARESKILFRINSAFPLAPKPYFFCEDRSLIGAPFYVMERRRGTILDSSFPEGFEPTPALCRGISETAVDTLVGLHAVDWEGAGLGDLGHPKGFLARQVKGWIGRYEKAKTEEIGEIRPLAEYMVANVPEGPRPTIIHNDYKLNNLLLNPDDPTEVRAILDWEMATIGDPLFDLAVSMSYWIEPGDHDELKAVLPTVTDAAGFLTREEFMELYAERSGRDLSEMRFYLILGYFKLAVILQQIYVRWHRGQTKDERFAGFGERVRNLIDHAHNLSRSDGA
jgi:aminoglycoside phosphotransferase (APT) family kinase protein